MTPAGAAQLQPLLSGAPPALASILPASIPKSPPRRRKSSAVSSLEKGLAGSGSFSQLAGWWPRRITSPGDDAQTVRGGGGLGLAPLKSPRRARMPPTHLRAREPPPLPPSPGAASHPLRLGSPLIAAPDPEVPVLKAPPSPRAARGDLAARCLVTLAVTEGPRLRKPEAPADGRRALSPTQSTRSSSSRSPGPMMSGGGGGGGGASGSGWGATADSWTAGGTPGRLRLRSPGSRGGRDADAAIRASPEPRAPPPRFSPATRARDSERRATERGAEANRRADGGCAAGLGDPERAGAARMMPARSGAEGCTLGHRRELNSVDAY